MSKLRQQADRVHARAIGGVMIGFLISTALGVAVAWGLESCWSSELGRSRRTTAQVPPEINAIETRPYSVEAQGIDDNQQAESWLSSYGWIDRKSRVVHIPIETAIDLYLDGRQQKGAAK